MSFEEGYCERREETYVDSSFGERTRMTSGFTLLVPDFGREVVVNVSIAKVVRNLHSTAKKKQLS